MCIKTKRNHVIIKVSHYYYFLVLFILMSSCKQNYQLESQAKFEFIEIDSSIGIPDAEMLKFLEPYKQKLDSEMNQPIAFSEIPLTRNKPNGSLNNFAADMIMDKNLSIYKILNENIDLVFINYGSLRKDLSKGNITRGDIFELMPFENELVLLKVKGNIIDSIVKYIDNSGGESFSGLAIQKNNKTQKMSATIEGKPINQKKQYNLLISDYLANGGDNMGFLKLADTIIHTNQLLRNVYFEYFKLHSQESLKIDTASRYIILP